MKILIPEAVAWEPADSNTFRGKARVCRLGATDQGGKVRLYLVEFEAGEIALEVGTRVELVVEVLGDGFHKLYTGSASGIWISTKGAMGEATSDVLAEVLSDEAFQALADPRSPTTQGITGS